MSTQPDLTKCASCELLIPTACTRCTRPFKPLRTVSEVDRLHDRIAALTLELERQRARPLLLFPHALPDMDAWKDLLIGEAIRRVGPSNAGPLIGMGRTSIFRRHTRESKSHPLGESIHATP